MLLILPSDDRMHFELSIKPNTLKGRNIVRIGGIHMDRVVWKPIKEMHCEKMRQDVVLEAQVVFPANFMPMQSPRVISHRCSMGMQCNSIDKPSCKWAGTLPDFDPFL